MSPVLKKPLKNEFLVCSFNPRYPLNIAGVLQTISPISLLFKNLFLLDNILINEKNINEVAVIGVKRDENEDICLFVKNNNKITKDYVKKICIKKLSLFQIPNRIYLINHLPKTNLGKINKKLLFSFL